MENSLRQLTAVSPGTEASGKRLKHARKCALHYCEALVSSALLSVDRDSADKSLTHCLNMTRQDSKQGQRSRKQPSDLAGKPGTTPFSDSLLLKKQLQEKSESPNASVEERGRRS